MRAAFLALILFALAVAPAMAKPKPTLIIFAAASLTDVLPQVADAWAKTDGGAAVAFSFDATSRLGPQIEQGAPADAFIAADAEWLDWMVERRLIAQGSRKTLAGNALVAVVHKNAKYIPTGVKGLIDPRIRHLALAGESVPAAKYAQTALMHYKLWDAVQDRVVRGTNVRATLAYVATGEAEAGIVYRTDALADPRVQLAFRFPEDSHPPIVYPAAVVKASKQQQLAAEFLTFCMSDEGQAIFAKAGFTPPPQPRDSVH